MEFLQAGSDPSVGRPTQPRAAAVARLVTFSALCALAYVLIGPTARAAASTETFSYTGGEQTFTVPAGVYTVQAVAVGGHGGNGTAPGGSASEVTGELSVTPGETLYVEVGGDGGEAGRESPGGFNGGGAGRERGAGGGGASDVRTSPAAFGLSPGDRLLVAGGGGGGGNTVANNEGACISGAGGAADGAGEASSCGAGGGGPGTQASGGAGGGGSGRSGEPGGFGYGGRGGYGDYGGGGSGGGGGYYGGGGGEADIGSGSAGGGGGSSLVPAEGSVALASADIQPQVQLAYLGPVAVTGTVSGTSQAAVTLNATVNPEGKNVTACDFEYGTSPSYGSSVPCTSLPGSGSSPVDVSAYVTGLSINSTYYYRIVATNALGTGDGVEQTFSSLPNSPVAVSTTASGVAPPLATLNATVNPEGGKVTACDFEYGTSPSYGSSVPCTSLPGYGSSPVDVSAYVTGLSINSTYYYRIVATNAGGTSYGSQSTLDTANAKGYTYTGAEQTFTVPAGVFSVNVEAVGGQGGSMRPEYTLAGAAGGLAAQVSGELSVTPGETLYVEVGGNGEEGGFNGGGTGDPGAGGGGASDIRTSPLAAGLSPDDRLLIAGGGGGAAQGGRNDYPARPGSNAGEGSGSGGGGGTQSRGGYAGERQDPCPAGDVLPGELGSGGDGVEGGGGGGFYGGGGGGCGENVRGGGGGSSLVPPGGSLALASSTVQPQMRINWEINAIGRTVAVTDTASGITQTSATLDATVNPEGETLTDCHFEYGRSESYGSSMPCSTLPGSGASPVAVSASLTGLSSATSYYYRIVATDGGGKSYGSEKMFSTRVSTRRFLYTDGEQTLTVPAGVTSVQALAVGGWGGSVGSAGGAPAEVSGEVSVTPGEILYLEVGGNGGNGASGGEGGFNGGAIGAGGGGGASDVRTSPRASGLAPDDRVLVAGGGGGSGADNCCAGSTGGAPGGAAGEAGEGSEGGGPGTQTGGGSSGEYGEAGQLGAGGTGGEYGGGGGGGYYGGGGGGAAFGSSKGGGGGGSSLVPAGGSVRLASASTEPQIQISYEGQPAPVVVTGSALAVKQTSAIVPGTVTAEGTVSSCVIEYGTSPAYGSNAPCNSPGGSGSAPEPVSATLTGLSPNTTYYYRLAATNEVGTSYGSEQSFRTPVNPPVVLTQSPSSLGQASATLNAIVNPESGRVTTCHFEYGTSASYGSEVPCSSLPGSGASPVSVSASIAGLMPGTTYHYRIVATNGGGTSEGEDQSFTTLTAFAVATGSLPTGEINAGYSETLQASGGVARYSWSLVSGALPAGLRLNPQTGAILGTPTAAGTASFTVQVTDSSTPTARTSTAQLSIDVSAATTGEAEYGVCVAQKKANYTNANCSAKAVEAPNGKYEWKPGPAPMCIAKKKGEYTSASCATKSAKPHKGKYEKAPGSGYTAFTGAVTLHGGELGVNVFCASGTATGEVTGAKAAAERFTLSGCEAASNPCQSVGPNGTPSGTAGAIDTNLLDTRLLGPTGGQVYVQLLSGEHAPYIAEIDCEGTLVRIIGSIAGLQAGNIGTPSYASSTRFGAGLGEQALASELSTDGGEKWAGPDTSTLATLSANTAASQTEIKP